MSFTDAADAEGEEWKRGFLSPVISFAPGERVPEWVFQCEPRKYQRFLKFAAHVEVRMDDDEVVIMHRPGERSALIRFRPEWWRTWARAVSHGFPKAKLLIKGAPTVFVDVDGLGDGVSVESED